MQVPRWGARRAVIDGLRAAIRSAIDGSGSSTLVVTAGPGSGKTHTLRELASRSGTAMRWSTAEELSWRQPYSVVANLLDTKVPKPVPAGFDTALYMQVDSLCASAPQLLVIDDAHNADAGTLELLGRLAAAAADLPLAMLIARRHLPNRELLTRLLARSTVREWNLPPMDATDLNALAYDLLGAWPDARLADSLGRSAGNPMLALKLIDGMRARITVRDGRATTHRSTESAPLVSLDETVREQLAMLADAATDLVQKLAVWGGSATLTELAALDGTRPSALVGAAQTAIDAGVLAVSDETTLTFTHDVYADVAYQKLSPALRAVLHGAVAEHHEAVGEHQLVAHHLLAAGADQSVVTAAVSRAHGELSQVPAVAVDLLETATQPRSGSWSAAPTLELDLALALCRTGQLDRSAQVAADGLVTATDPETVAQLHRILMFTLLVQGKTSQVRNLITETVSLPIDPATRAVLLDVERYVGLLEGSTQVPRTPFPYSTEGPATGMIAEALRRFLSGEVATGLQIALSASRFEGAADHGFEISTSADIWSPFIEAYVHGPAAAEALLDRAIQLRTDRGAAWMTAYHEFTRGAILLARGHLEDAAASFDSGLERTERTDMGWTSLAEGGRALIDVYRSDFSAAATRLDTFARSGLPDQFGIPACARSQALLFEAQRKLRPATSAARGCLDHATDLGLFGWLPTFAIDCARIARRSGDIELLGKTSDVLDRLPTPVPAAGSGSVALARALSSETTDAIGAVALRCAQAAHDQGDAICEAAAWEEAACAAAGLGDKVAAREYAHHTLVLTQAMGASALSARVTSRLRAMGLRLEPTAVRDRPRTGWQSLTRTEVTVVELVALGLNGSEIAERLFISPRTVQTHVSHALRKMNLRTRVDLAAFVVGRQHDIDAASHRTT